MALNIYDTRYSVQTIFNRIYDDTNQLISVKVGNAADGSVMGRVQLTDANNSGIIGTDTLPLNVKMNLTNRNITTATTTTVKSGSGHLHAITINATAAGTITIYDNTSATGTKIGTLKASIVEQTFFFDCAFTTGLTIVTGAASDISVSYI